MTKSSKIIRI